MKLKKYLIIVILLLLSTLFSGCIIEQTENDDINQNGFQDNQKETASNISIACWNLQIFGQSKASNNTLLDYYTDKLDDYDIFIVQEIRDISGTAIEILADKFPDY